MDADVQGCGLLLLTSGRVHGGEVEQVSQGSAALAWWSADAESDSRPGERSGGGGSGVSQGMKGGKRGVRGLKGGGRKRWRSLGGVIALAIVRSASSW